MLPHEVFGALWPYPELFEYILSGGAEAISGFWNGARERNTEWFRQHPALQGADTDHVVPIGIHGDEAGHWAHEKTLVLSWSSVSTGHWTLDNRITWCLMQCPPEIKNI